MGISDSGYDYGITEPIGMASVPGRAYHGTGAKIDEFRLSRRAKVPRLQIWLTPDQSVGQHYGLIRAEKKQQPRVYGVDLDWHGVERIPMFSRAIGDVRAMVDWSKEHGYPAFWITQSYAGNDYIPGVSGPPELVIIDDRKVSLRVIGARQLTRGEDHEGYLGELGIALGQMQREHGGRLSEEECVARLKEKFADHPNPTLLHQQIMDLCEQRSRAFLPELSPIEDAVDEYRNAQTRAAPTMPPPGHRGGYLQRGAVASRQPRGSLRR